MNEVDDIRLEEFRQLKKEIRGSTEVSDRGDRRGQGKASCFFRYGHGEDAVKAIDL